MNQRPATAPLEKWLRVIECGAYKKAAKGEDYAFEKLANMWSDKMEDDSDSDSDHDPDDSNNKPLRRPPTPLRLCKLDQKYSIASTSRSLTLTL
jgi:hypothetical protein